jgi:septum site-determining protein MinD
MTRFIGIVSGKGGVGKTTTAINLGTALSNLGKDAVVLDGNLTAPNIGIYLGANNPPVTFHEILDGTAQIGDSVYLHASGLRFIPGSIRLNALEKLDLNQLRKAFNKLKGISEIILIDTGSGLTKETLSVMNFADEVLVVTNPEAAAVAEALKTIKKAEEQGILVLGAVLNRTREEGNEISIENVESLLGKPILASIPESESIKKAQAMKHPIVYLNPDLKESLEFRMLAEKLK